MAAVEGAVEGASMAAVEEAVEGARLAHSSPPARQLPAVHPDWEEGLQSHPTPGTHSRVLLRI